MTTLTITAVTASFASGTLTSNNTNVSDGHTVTIGTTVYTFKSTLAAVGQVKIGGDADASLRNFILAVNDSGVNFDGTNGTTANYYVTAAHAQVAAVGAVTAHAVVVKSLTAGTAGNSIATTETATGSVLAWGSGTLTGGSDTVTITATISNVTYTQPAQMQTIGDFPATNTSWYRALTLATQAAFVNRNDSAGVAITLASLSAAAYGVERTLTWPPIIATQPAAASCVANSTAATFTVVATVEATATYQWQYFPTGGPSWLNATGTVNGCVYTNDTTATLTCTPTTTGQTGLSHRCVVSNGAGATESDGATLTIT